MNEDQETLGYFLKRERQKKDISLEQVSYATRISLKMLRSLEEDEHDALPAQPFVRGYLKAYSKYVALDTKDILLRYQHHLATLPNTNQKKSDTYQFYAKERKQEKKKLMLVLSLAALLVAGSVSYLIIKKQIKSGKTRYTQKARKLKNNPLAKQTASSKSAATANKSASSPKTTDTTKTEKTTTAKAKPVAKNNETMVGAIKNFTARAAAKMKSEIQQSTNLLSTGKKQKYNLELQAKEDVWFRFQLDKEEVKDIMLRADRKVLLKADSVIKIFSGNLGGLKAKLNGEGMKSLTTLNRTKSAVIPIERAEEFELPLFPEQMSQDQAKLKAINKEKQSTTLKAGKVEPSGNAATQKQPQLSLSE